MTIHFSRESNRMSEVGAAIFPRTLRIVYWPADARVVDQDRARLEQGLRQLGSLQIETLKTLDELAAKPADLLVVAAQTVPGEQFSKWLRSFKERVKNRGGIWTPALILANLPFPILNEVMPEAVQDNWYFDILAADHLASMPIRVANLLRIHDHLHELQRYAATLDSLSAKVQKLEDELEALKQA
jgi:hypothetical protein